MTHHTAPVTEPDSFSAEGNRREQARATVNAGPGPPFTFIMEKKGILNREAQTPTDRTEQEGPRRRAYTRTGDSRHQASLSGSPEPSLAPDQHTMGAHEGGPLEGSRLKDSPHLQSGNMEA